MSVFKGSAEKWGRIKQGVFNEKVEISIIFDSVSVAEFISGGDRQTGTGRKWKNACS